LPAEIHLKNADSLLMVASDLLAGFWSKPGFEGLLTTEAV